MKAYVRIFGLAAICAAGLDAKAPDAFWTSVQWDTPDAVRLAGAYHAATSPDRLTWVLQHGLGSTKGEWDAFSRALAATGQGVFVFDARGHGGSVRMSGGQPVDYHSFTRFDWQQMPGDMGSAVQFLIKAYALNASHIAVGGASLGANVALLYASAHAEVPAVLLLSSGMEYAGLSIDRAFGQYGSRPLLMAASPDDRYAFETLQAMTRRRTDPGLRLIEGSGAQHGVNMLDAPTTEKIIRWTTGL